jgi:two-component system, chemotaxis family, CheB/CheR fusion protein
VSEWETLVKRSSLPLPRPDVIRQSYDDLATANEELRLLNDELVAAHEALARTNDELTRVNEELTWVNGQLERRNQECSGINADLLNLIAAVNIPMLILDTEQRIRRFTTKIEVLVELAAGDIGRKLSDFPIKIAGPPDLADQIREVMAGLPVKESEVRDQQGHWYRLQIRPYRTADGRIDGAILSLIDIDDLRRLVADAVAARTEAERANGAKDQFLATLSHELRTPLTSILVNAQMLLEKEPDLPQRRRAYEAIARGTRVQKQLIDDLLDVSGIVSGKMRMELRAVDLRAVVMMAIEQVRLAAERKHIKLEIQVEPVGLVAGDPVRLEQVAANLLNNAIKFTPEGGRVAVALSESGSEALFQIIDSGIGIDPAFLAQVFERFAQADKSPTRKHGGLGLGLTIARHLVEMHGGTVKAESAGTGTGSSFTVRLPRLAVRTAALEMAGPLPMTGLLAGWERLRGRGPGTATVRPRILVVDDDYDTREAVAEMIEQTGALVRMVGSAAAALTAFAEFEPTLIVSDIAMPIEDGCSLLRKIRALGPDRGGNVPAIALTALAREDDRARALAAGFQLFVAKPVDMNHLKQVVMSLAASPQENKR